MVFNAVIKVSLLFAFIIPCLVVNHTNIRLKNKPYFFNVHGNSVVLSEVFLPLHSENLTPITGFDTKF